jgi:hypothetical protein
MLRASASDGLSAATPTEILRDRYRGHARETGSEHRERRRRYTNATGQTFCHGPPMTDWSLHKACSIEG